MKRFKLILRPGIRSFLFKLNQPPWIILTACILAYGVMIPWLGLYMDDWVYLSALNKFGPEGLTRYFSTNRPVWGLIYQATLPILGKTPWHWHVFGLFWHFAAAISLWWLLTLIWPKQKNPALWAGLLFAVYPGFTLQPISITFGHIFLVYTSYFLSICFLVLAWQRPKNFRIYTVLAFSTSAINLLCMEYFLLLHLLQPIVLWFVFQQQAPKFRSRLCLVIKAWWPYFILFVGNLIWRTVFFKYQTNNYQYLFLERFKNGAIPAFFHLLKTMLRDWWNTSLVAWINVYKMPFDLQGGNFIYVYLLVVLAATVFFFISIYKFSQQSQGETEDKGSSLQMLALGSLALLIAGAPFWLTEINVGLVSFPSRFTLPFIFGAVLLLSSLLQLIQRPRWLVMAFLAITIGLSIGYQLQNNNDFRREWIVQKNLMWQLAWRLPSLEQGTTIFMKEMPVSHHITQTILSPMVDWNFHPRLSSGEMNYAVYYPREMANAGVLVLQPGQKFQYDHLGALFTGNSNRSFTVQFSKDNTFLLSCAHVMSSSFDGGNPFLTIEEKKVASFSDPNLIHASQVLDSNQLFPEIFGQEPEPTHCYYFEKADLAYQLKEWQLAIDFHNLSLSLGDSSWNDTELVPVIGSYAHIGEWEHAYSLTTVMASRSYYPLSPLICDLWKSLATDTPDGGQKQGTIQAISEQFECQK